MKKILFLITVAILAPTCAAQAGGWYLMTPPLTLTWSGWTRTKLRQLGTLIEGKKIDRDLSNQVLLTQAYFDLEAPLSKWTEQQAFTSLDGCRDYIQGQLEEAARLEAESQPPSPPNGHWASEPPASERWTREPPPSSTWTSKSESRGHWVDDETGKTVHYYDQTGKEIPVKPDSSLIGPPVPPNPLTAKFYDAYEDARCIASDDPRLGR